MSHSVWSGYLSFGLISIPIRAFPAARAEGMSFCFLHRTCKSRVGQRYYCKGENDKVIPHNELVKAYEYGPDQYVLIEKDDFEAIEPDTAETMQISEFVELRAVDPVYFESGYYLMPQDQGARPYAILAKALKQSKRAAVAKLAMHNREYAVLIRPADGGLMLHTLYYPDEVRSVDGFGQNVPVSVKDVKLVQRLIKALAKDWQPLKFKDGFRSNMEKMIQAKIAGQQLEKRKKAKRPAAVVEIGRAHV